MNLYITGASATNATSCCSLSGITCNGALVTGFDVNSQGINGSIPAEIGKLVNLQEM